MSAVAASIALDDAMVETIATGKFSDSGKAIGVANLATLQAAAQRCKEVAGEASGRGLPFRQYQDRALLCRRRIQIIAEKQKATSQPVL